MSSEEADRDRYAEAMHDMTEHIGDKILALLRKPENQSRIQSVLDPIVSHIINRVFPYILLSAILFLILLILTVGTFWMVMKTNTPLGIVARTAGLAMQDSIVV